MMTSDDDVSQPHDTTTHSHRPVATIYQNSDQIAGILQQIVRQPLIIDETREATSGGASDMGMDAAVKGDTRGKFKVPFTGGLDFGIQGQTGLNTSWTQNTGTASRQQFVYSQAYYLHLVREYLAVGGHLTTLSSADQALELEPGHFVKYTTAFDPVELTLALDVISPELVEAIARYIVKRSFMASFPVAGGHEAHVTHAQRMEVAAQAQGELARSITNAVAADTRQGTTREYYGRLTSSPALTAITVCDLAHFIVDDPDRLLDGTFTVLGKVISAVETDAPTFARNKLLRNLAPEAFDTGIAQLQAMIRKVPEVGGSAPSSFVDLKLDSRVRGQSIRVIPLAIFT